MQITLHESEITEAVEAYVRDQINIKTNQSISIDFTAGRGSNGLTASLDISNRPVTANKPVMRAVSKPVVEEIEPEPMGQGESSGSQDEAPEAVEEETDPTPDEVQEEEKDEAPAPSNKSIFSKKKAG